MRIPCTGASFAAGIVAIVAAGCRSPQEPAAPERAAELLGARIPAVVAPGTGFQLVAYFGRGACETSHPDVEVTPTGAAIGMRLRQVPIPPGTACTMNLLKDSVVAHVVPPITLPYTVRLQRADRPDSVVIVRASERVG